MNLLSLIYFFEKVYSKITRITMSAVYKSSLKSFGKKSKIISPIKIEGARFIEIGNYVDILDFGWIMALEKIENIKPQLVISDGTYIGHFCHIVSIKSVKIGKKVLIADKVYISDNLHGYHNISLPVIDHPVVFKDVVVIGDGSWIGENVCIIGAKIGMHCIIAANSVVTKSIPDYCVAAGSPAIILKRYNMKTEKWEKTNKDGDFINE